MVKGLYCPSCARGCWRWFDVGVTVEAGTGIKFATVLGVQCLKCDREFLFDVLERPAKLISLRSEEADTLLTVARQREWDSQFKREDAAQPKKAEVRLAE